MTTEVQTRPAGVVPLRSCSSSIWGSWNWSSRADASRYEHVSTSQETTRKRQIGVASQESITTCINPQSPREKFRLLPGSQLGISVSQRRHSKWLAGMIGADESFDAAEVTSREKGPSRCVDSVHFASIHPLLVGRGRISTACKGPTAPLSVRRPGG